MVLGDAELFALEDAATDAVDQETLRKPIEVPVPVKVRRYVERIFAKHDKDLDEVLAPDEWSGMCGYPILIAGSAEKTITKKQLTQYVAGYGYRRKIRLLFSPMKLESFRPTLLHPSEAISNGSLAPVNGSANATTSKNSNRTKPFYVPAKHLPNGLPNWFFTRDSNGDGQLSFSEFAVEGTQNRMREFKKFDTNHDGILSPRDLVKTIPKKPVAKKATKSGVAKPGAKKPTTPEPVPAKPVPANIKPVPTKPVPAYIKPVPEKKPEPTATPKAEKKASEEKPKPKKSGTNRRQGRRGNRR